MENINLGQAGARILQSQEVYSIAVSNINLEENVYLFFVQLLVFRLCDLCHSCQSLDQKSVGTNRWEHINEFFESFLWSLEA